MPPKKAAAGPTQLPECGFAVRGTKKGELLLKVEKRARGKKVTLIPNVAGDASKLVRLLQTLLGVGGTARRSAETYGLWVVEVQGEQVQRVTNVLLEMQCLQGLTQAAMAALRPREDASAVARTTASKFLAQTAAGGALSPEEEKRRQLEKEAEDLFDFYSGPFWQAAAGQSSFGSIEEDLAEIFELEPAAACEGKGGAAQPLPELNAALRRLGLLSESGPAVREFWERPGMTLAQFRKEALRFGASLITEEPGRKKKPTNLKARQRVSDLGGPGSSRASYFSLTCPVFDEYRKKLRRGVGGEEDAAQVKQASEQLLPPEVVVKQDESGNWYRASLMVSCSAILPTPVSRLPQEELAVVARSALRTVKGSVDVDLQSACNAYAGMTCQLDCDTNAVEVLVREEEMQNRREGAEKVVDKEELKLEKKLREISALQQRALAGEVLEKLQLDKVQRRGELFGQVAELRIRRAEKAVRKALKAHLAAFQEAFWDWEWRELYGAEESAAASGGGGAMGTFDKGSAKGAVELSTDGLLAEGRAAQWTGVCLRLSVKQGEVGAFAVEVLGGLVRLGWTLAGGAVGEVGSDALGYGFGASGKRVHANAFEAYGEAFGVGDTIHCEAEREDGQLRIGFAKNGEPLGVAFDVLDPNGAELVAVACGRGFKVRLVSAECMPLEEAAGLEGFVEFETPRMAVVQEDFRDESEGCLPLWAGETVHVSSDDGQGWLFGFFLDPEDPEDGGWFPAACVQYLDQAELQAEPGMEAEPAWSEEVPAAPAQAWGAAAPAAEEDVWAAPAAKAPQEEVVEGLGAWLQGLSLQKYEAKAVAWCHEMGAVSLDEVREEWEDLAEALALKPLERKRLAKAVAA